MSSKTKKGDGLYFCVLRLFEFGENLARLHIIEIDPKKRGLIDRLLKKFREVYAYRYYIKHFSSEALKTGSDFNFVFKLTVDDPMTKIEYSKIESILEGSNPKVNLLRNIGIKMGSSRFDPQK